MEICEMLISWSQIELRGIMIGLVVSEPRFTVVLLSQIDLLGNKIWIACYSLKSILSLVYLKSEICENIIFLSLFLLLLWKRDLLQILF